jgi:hypothetical protein
MLNTLSTATAQILSEIYGYHLFSVDTTSSQDTQSCLVVTGQCGSGLRRGSFHQR